MRSEIAAVGNYLLSVPERALGIRMGIDGYKIAREAISLNPDRPHTRLSRVNDVLNRLSLFMGGASTELLLPTTSALMYTSAIEQRQGPLNTPFNSLLESSRTVEAMITGLCVVTDLAVDLVAYTIPGPEAIQFKLGFNAASHVLVDALKAGVNNIHNFRNSPTVFA